ncbi:MAG: winged helix-turn-helix transcriptional regulator [Spirochaetales bacterium]|nr:winged helix-turn-helix transcriptional regulator [Leptospiraceae bacterium]MCP5482620.1 winged helix-turn-helix transcriptional regulator [Spirochaetales bacterium]MCP5485001.1 winged helix-turn-helix transcriptional regulator [Spirochaetales bacterium]
MVLRRDPFQAIADPTRRAILVLLASRTMSAGELALQFDIARPAVSRHLRILNECRLIQARPEGRQISYALRIEKLREIDRWLERLRAAWESRYDQLDSLLTNLNNGE